MQFQILSKIVVFLILIQCYFGSSPNSYAQETDLSPSNHIPILCKVLSFDRNLKQRSPTVIKIGLVYQSKYRTSLNTMYEIQRYFIEHSIKISGINVAVRLIDLSEENLSTIINSEDITVLYIAPLRAYNIASLHGLCATKKIRSITGVSDYVSEGISVGVGTKGGKAEIIINRPSSNREGADYSAQLLKLSRIIE
ncbi:MAG: YfiR family protein [Ignavibacteria bacterium]|nr:YfiR family protein [Ignavibacteria bacterium]